MWAYYKFLAKLEKEPVLEMSYGIEIINKYGKITDKEDGRAESFVRNFYNFLAQNMLGIQPSTYSMGAYGDGSLVMNDTGGVDRTSQFAYMRNLAAYDIELLNTDIGYGGLRIGNGIAKGIVFDQSDTAYTFEQVVGVTPVANGTGANQLTYGDTFLPYMTYDAGSDLWTCIWERMALNNTVGQTTVDIKSICLYAIMVTNPGGTANTFMIARDVLVSTITVPYNNQIKGRWTLTHDR